MALTRKERVLTNQDTNVVSELLDWSRTNQESYPFRHTKSAYEILVCEILLRKTTAKQVSNIYEKFFVRFPTIGSLASASAKEVLEVIRPLGIWRRAYDLNRLAREIVTKHGGRVPHELTALTSMKGVGRYVANCVLAFAYGRNVPMVDSNVERVISRLLGVEPCGKGTPKEAIWEAYSELAPVDRLRQFHYALIDLSHKVCRNKDPQCAACPLVEHCRHGR